MPLVDALLPEFDREIAVTRVLLERVPDDTLGWKPHEKAYSLAGLAGHIANLPHWGVLTITLPGLDLADYGQNPLPSSRAEAVAALDAHARELRGHLQDKTDAELLAPWTLKQRGKVLLTMPKMGILRSFVMNHLIHHRGQLTVYLRQLGVALPSIYGPSADDNPFA